MTSFGKATIRSSTSAVAMGIVLTGTAAWADVTAQNVWDDWKGYMTSSGYTLTAEEEFSGGTFSVKNIIMDVDVPEEDATVKIELGDITFVEKGDGSVSIQFPPTVPVKMIIDGPAPLSFSMDYSNTNLVMDASGDPNNLTYTYSADEVALSLNELVAEGENIDIGALEMKLVDLAGATKMSVGDTRMADQKVTAGAITYAMDFQDPENNDARFVLNGNMDGIEMAGTTTLPLEMDSANFGNVLAEGAFAVDLDMSFGANAVQLQVTEPDTTVDASSTSESGQLKLLMSDKGLLYDVASRGMNVAMSGGDIPFPVEFALSEAAFKFGMPIVKGEEEQDYAVGFRMVDFTMSDLIWGLFDPTGQLPRDPATIDLDMSGKAKLFFNLMNPDEIIAMETSGEVPGELNSLSLNTLVLRLAGAELTGSGAFTFDNADLITFDGLPAADGSIDLTILGANKLLDTLVSMGFVPEEQATGARLMMGLFAVPGEGEDSLTSTIEVKPDGQVLANGQRLR